MKITMFLGLICSLFCSSFAIADIRVSAETKIRLGHCPYENIEVYDLIGERTIGIIPTRAPVGARISVNESYDVTHLIEPDQGILIQIRIANRDGTLVEPIVCGVTFQGETRSIPFVSRKGQLEAIRMVLQADPQSTDENELICKTYLKYGLAATPRFNGAVDPIIDSTLSQASFLQQ